MKDDIRKEIMVPPVIDWRITADCNNSCPFCYASETIKEADEKGVSVILDKLYGSGCRTVCITGGEPLCSPYLLQILGKLKQRHFMIFLATNGINYMCMRNQIEPYITKLALPLDGYDAESTAESGRDPIGFERVNEILKLYSESRPKFQLQIGTVLTRKNCSFDFLEKMSTVIKKYPIDIWKLYEVIPEGRGMENYKVLLPDKKNIEKLRMISGNFNEKSKCKIVLMERIRRNAAYFIIRPDGKVMIPIDNGTVKEKVIGDLLTENMKEIVYRWNKEIIQNNVIDIYTMRSTKCK